MVERRSRSTTRYAGGGDVSSVAPPIPATGPPPSSSSGAAAAASSSLLHRPGGDSRTLSPDRRNVRSSAIEASQHRTGSYNQYTGPPLSRLGLPSPRGQQQTSTPQTSPIKYEDFSLPLKKATEKLSYASPNINNNNSNIVNNNNHNLNGNKVNIINGRLG